MYITDLYEDNLEISIKVKIEIPKTIFEIRLERNRLCRQFLGTLPSTQQSKNQKNRPCKKAGIGARHRLEKKAMPEKGPRSISDKAGAVYRRLN